MTVFNNALNIDSGDNLNTDKSLALNSVASGKDNTAQFPQSDTAVAVEPQVQVSEVDNFLKGNTTPTETTPEAVETTTKKRFNMPKINLGRPRFPRILKRKVVWIPMVVILLLVGVFGFLGYRVYKEGKEFYATAMVTADLAKKQDLVGLKENIVTLRRDYEGFRDAYKGISVLKVLPYFGRFVADGEHALNGAEYGFNAGESAILAAEPFSDILGFGAASTEAGKDGEKTTEERIDFLVSAMPELVPKIDVIATELTKARIEIEKIDPARYPKKLFGKEIQEPLKKGIEMLKLTDELVVTGKPLLEVSPYLLGTDEKRKYLIIFQNDKELRPTGGFITAYSIAEVEKGKFNPVLSSDIYSLDAKYKPTVAAAQPVIDYLKGIYVANPKYRLRDLNWSPDFRDSIELFLTEAEKVGLEEVDGVIAVDTHLLVNILDVLGPIGVPGYGNFSTEITEKCNCPQVVYELESYADREGPIVWDPLDPTRIIYAPANFDNRKKIIGPLMNSILANAMAQPKEKLPALIEAGYKSVMEKHVMLYAHDDKVQAAAEKFGIAGRIEDFEGDYLHINDSNLGGRKSNLYVTQEVRQDIKVNRDGTVEKTLEITYKNPQSYDGWLNSVLPNWTRIYVPKGSEVIDVSGFEDTGESYEEFGKTVISGGFELRPQGISKVTVTYKLPFKVIDGTYEMLVQKQPGTDIPLYAIDINGVSEESYLREDKEFSFKVK